jgi:hypothetical protein
VGSEVRVFCILPAAFSPLWYFSRQGIKNHRSETARRRSRDLRAIIIYAAFCVSGFSVCFLAGQQAFGQITTSEIVGTVSDAMGAVVMNAKVAVTSTATVIPASSCPARMAVLSLTPITGANIP